MRDLAYSELVSVEVTEMMPRLRTFLKAASR